MTHHCRECMAEVPSRQPGQDGRCDPCRAELGRYRRPRTTARHRADDAFDRLIANPTH